MQPPGNNIFSSWFCSVIILPFVIHVVRAYTQPVRISHLIDFLTLSIDSSVQSNRHTPYWSTIIFNKISLSNTHTHTSKHTKQNNSRCNTLQNLIHTTNNGICCVCCSIKLETGRTKQRQRTTYMHVRLNLTMKIYTSVKRNNKQVYCILILRNESIKIWLKSYTIW